MTSDNKFVDLDIKKLFEEHTIKDIELIQKHIQNESDRKKIELRTLVGERYRDLIQAADTIAEMQKTSESVVEKLINIEQTFYTLQQKYLIGFKVDVIDQSNITNETNIISNSIVMQIKILMDIPELIWSAIDSKDFLLASQLFLLAQHINYSLTIEEGEVNLLNKYPIVSKQWSIIDQFKNLIKNFCIDSLQSIELEIEVAANSLAALVLLEGLSSLDLLNKLISLRSQTVQTLLTIESNLNVKSKIKTCLSALMKTIPLISCCFIMGDSNTGLISRYINDIKKKDAISLLSHLDLNKELLNKFLPQVTKNYKPFEQYELENILVNSIQETIKQWFEWIKQFFTLEVTKLLNFITSIKGIYTIREDCLGINVPDNWEFAWSTFSMSSINFWLEFFQPLMTERVKSILNNDLAKCFNNLKQDVSKLLTEVTSETCQCQEDDLRWYIWKDDPMDLPLSLQKNDTINVKRPLLMKASAFSPNLLKLCDNFEKGLAELLSYLKQYLYDLDQTTVSSKLNEDTLVSGICLITNKFCDRNAIQEYLQTISSAHLDDFILFLKQDCTIENPIVGKQNVNAIISARFLQAVPTQCFNFKECFAMSRTTSLTMTNMKWQEICDKIKQESTYMWSIWAKCFLKHVHNCRYENLINETSDELQTHVIIMDWERVTIEEEAEEGKRIQSEILVPYHPAVHLQKFLTWTCREMNKVIPHTVPRVVLNDIISNLAAELLDYYEKLCINPETRQKQAIQLLFDVKYVTLLMIPRDEKSLVEKSNQVCNVITSKIDPFDLDVFYPFINTNVKKSVSRSLLLNANLVPHMEQLRSVLGAKINEKGSEELKPVTKDPPGILALCTGSPWFPPLAVTAPVQDVPASSIPPVTQEKTLSKKKQGSKEQGKTDVTGSTIKSGAAAFFGAMGSDWFGSS